MELRLRYIRDRSSASHVWDHIDDRPDHALCGHAYEDPVELASRSRPKRVCRKCQVLLPKAEALLWRRIANDAAKELKNSKREALRIQSHYDALWIEYEAYTTDYETVRVDYETLLGDYERLWNEYDSLWATHKHLEVHADNQRQQLSRLQRTRSSNSDKREPNPRSSTKTTNKSTQSKNPKKRSSGRINPGRRVPNGRPRVRFVS